MHRPSTTSTSMPWSSSAWLRVCATCPPPRSTVRAPCARAVPARSSGAPGRPPSTWRPSHGSISRAARLWPAPTATKTGIQTSPVSTLPPVPPSAALRPRCASMDLPGLASGPVAGAIPISAARRSLVWPTTWPPRAPVAPASATSSFRVRSSTSTPLRVIACATSSRWAAAPRSSPAPTPTAAPPRCRAACCRSARVALQAPCRPARL